jgi:hypothetical protein
MKESGRRHGLSDGAKDKADLYNDIPAAPSILIGPRAADGNSPIQGIALTHQPPASYTSPLSV